MKADTKAHFCIVTDMDRNPKIWGPGNHKLVENPSFKLPEHIFKPNPKVQLADALLACRLTLAASSATRPHDPPSRPRAYHLSAHSLTTPRNPRDLHATARFAFVQCSRFRHTRPPLIRRARLPPSLPQNQRVQQQPK